MDGKNPFAAGASSAAAAPNAGGRAWWMVIVLALVVVSAFADRAVIAVVAEPIKHDLGVSDFQISLLLGIAFNIVYSLSAIPLGHVADRVNRRNLLVIAILTWSVMTMLSGFAMSFAILFVGRMGLGFAEAVLNPVGFSLIRDSFSQKQRGRAFALFNGGHLVGVGLAFLVGGGLLAAASVGGFASWPFVGGLAPWRVVLVLLGTCFVPLAFLLLLTVREPARGEQGAAARTGYAEAWAHVRAHRAAFLPFWGALALCGMAQGAVAGWAPAAVHRAWQVPLPQIGYALGIMQMVLVPVGAIIAGIAIDRAARGNRAAPGIRAGSVFLGIATLTGITLMLTRDMAIAMPLYGVQLLCFASFPIIMSTTLADLAPTGMAGKLQAMSGLAVTLVGLGTGPTVVVFVSDLLFSGPRALLDATLLVFTIGAGAGLLSFRCVRMQDGRAARVEEPAPSGASPAGG